MTLKVIGAGFGRTGTTSIKAALEMLGLGPCHHMSEVFEKPAQLPFWQDCVAGKPADWCAFFAPYRSAVDWPSTHYWRELAEVFPTAKILLSVREEPSWLSSFERTIKPLILRRNEAPDPHRLSVLEFAKTMIADQAFGGDLADRERLLSAYRERIAAVERDVPADRRLRFDVADGWQPLCRFLDVPVPREPFPRLNDSREFWSHFGLGLNAD